MSRHISREKVVMRTPVDDQCVKLRGRYIAAVVEPQRYVHHNKGTCISSISDWTTADSALVLADMRFLFFLLLFCRGKHYYYYFITAYMNSHSNLSQPASTFEHTSHCSTSSSYSVNIKQTLSPPAFCTRIKTKVKIRP